MINDLQLGYGNPNLLIRVFPDGISYSITDDREQVLFQQMISIPAGKLKDNRFFEHFFELPELQLVEENVSIIYYNNFYQLIPSDFFHEQDVRVLYELEFGNDKNTKLAHNLLPKWGVHLVFGVPESLMIFLENKYPDADVEHHIYRLLKKEVSKSDSKMYIFSRKDAIDLVVVKDGVLCLVNAYQTKTKEDICYYVLNVYSQLELDVAHFPIKLIKNDSHENDAIELLRKYIVNVIE